MTAMRGRRRLGSVFLRAIRGHIWQLAAGCFGVAHHAEPLCREGQDRILMVRLKPTKRR
jgi:hypothetical protein